MTFVGKAPSARNAPELLIRKLIALLFCELQDVLGGLAGLRLLLLLGGEVLELHRMPPWSYFHLCIFYVQTGAFVPWSMRDAGL